MTTNNEIIDFILARVADEDIAKANGARVKLMPSNGSVGFYLKNGLLVRCLDWSGAGFDSVIVSKWVRTGHRAHEGRRVTIPTPDYLQSLTD